MTARIPSTSPAAGRFDRPTDLDDGVEKLEVQPVVAGWIRHALPDGELEQSADAVEVGVNPRELGQGLRVDCAFKASGPETASEDLCARTARLLSEGVEPTEIIVVDAAKWFLGLRIPCVLQGFHRSPKTYLL